MHIFTPLGMVIVIFHILGVCGSLTLFISFVHRSRFHTGTAFEVVGHALRVADAHCTYIHTSHPHEPSFQFQHPNSSGVLWHASQKRTAHSLAQSITRSLTRSITNSLAHSLTHSLTHSINQSLAHSIT